MSRWTSKWLNALQRATAHSHASLRTVACRPLQLREIHTAARLFATVRTFARSFELFCGCGASASFLVRLRIVVHLCAPIIVYSRCLVLLQDSAYCHALLHAFVTLHASLCSLSCFCSSSCATEDHSGHAPAGACLCALLGAYTRFPPPPWATAHMFVLFCVLAILYALQRDAAPRGALLRASAFHCTPRCAAARSYLAQHAAARLWLPQSLSTLLPVPPRVFACLRVPPLCTSMLHVFLIL